MKPAAVSVTRPVYDTVLLCDPTAFAVDPAGETGLEDSVLNFFIYARLDCHGAAHRAGRP